MRRHLTLNDALRHALMEHYDEPGVQVVQFPLEEALASFLMVAGEIANSVPQTHRREAFRFMTDIVAASQTAGEQKITIGHALAKLRGVQLN